MSEFKEILEDLSENLNNVSYEEGDLSDVGNEIGIIIGKWINEGKLGYEKNSFLCGINHGISLIDGTH